MDTPFKQLRQNNRLTQAQLAKKSGISLSAIQKLDMGLIHLERAEAKTVYLLSKAFNIDMESLLKICSSNPETLKNSSTFTSIESSKYKVTKKSREALWSAISLYLEAWISAKNKKEIDDAKKIVNNTIDNLIK